MRESIPNFGGFATTPRAPTAKTYNVKCDDCKTTIRTTTDVRESYAGGQCEACKPKVKTFRNTGWTERDYECTNVVACQAEEHPCDCTPMLTGFGNAIHHKDCVGANYTECDESILVGLTQLWIERGVRYFGHL